MGFHFFALIRVAGEADNLHFIRFGKINLQRIVGIVTNPAVF